MTILRNMTTVETSPNLPMNLKISHPEDSQNLKNNLGRENPRTQSKPHDPPIVSYLWKGICDLFGQLFPPKMSTQRHHECPVPNDSLKNEDIHHRSALDKAKANLDCKDEEISIIEENHDIEEHQINSYFQHEVMACTMVMKKLLVEQAEERRAQRMEEKMLMVDIFNRQEAAIQDYKMMSSDYKYESGRYIELHETFNKLKQRNNEVEREKGKLRVKNRSLRHSLEIARNKVQALDGGRIGTASIGWNGGEESVKAFGNSNGSYSLF